MEKKTSSSDQPQIFKSNILEAMTKTTPLSNVLVYGPTIALLLYVAISVKGLAIGITLSWFFFAIFFWTLAEYLLHRYLFHWYTEAKWTQRFHYIIHGVHHEHVKDEKRLLMPPVPGLILASVLFGLFYIVFWMAGYPQLTWAFFPGFFLGYLLYSFMHYSIHKYKPPKFLKGLWIHHSLHHYKYPDKAFGVSTLIWDRIFGTIPPKK